MPHPTGVLRPFHRLLLYAGLLVAILVVVPAAGFDGPASAQTWLQAGWQAYQAGQMGQAANAFARAAATAPGSATPAVWMGAVLMAQGDQLHAGHWFRLALLLNPTTSQTHYVLAWLARLGQSVALAGAAAINPTKATPQRVEATTAEGITRFIRTSNPAISPSFAAWEGVAIQKAAAQEGVDQRLMTALVFVESRFDPGAVSPVGAQGLGQLMPETAAELGVNPRDPWQNLVGAARLLRQNEAQFHSLPLMLAAYNAGDGAVRTYGGIPPYPETQNYVWKILTIFGTLLG
ncbi:MAG TPA: lytic transglycosylase domain-containing protein [bacterium]|nr:lytic transglycosylase domain-containing protein [bacterium]